MVVPSWNHVFSRVQASQGGYLTWWPLAGTTCFHVSRPSRGVSNMVVPSWNHVVSRVQATQRAYLTWWPLAGTTCFTCPGHPDGVSNMGLLEPSWGLERKRRDFMCIRHRFVDFFPERAEAQGSLLEVSPRTRRL